MSRTLDLREMDPSAKSRSVANIVSLLQEGESFTVLSDADPGRILEEVLTADSLELLRLEYIEKGPQAWQLKLTRRSGRIDAKCESYGTGSFGTKR